ARGELVLIHLPAGQAAPPEMRAGEDPTVQRSASETWIEHAHPAPRHDVEHRDVGGTVHVEERPTRSVRRRDGSPQRSVRFENARASRLREGAGTEREKRYRCEKGSHRRPPGGI